MQAWWLSSLAGLLYVSPCWLGGWLVFASALEDVDFDDVDFADVDVDYTDSDGVDFDDEHSAYV